MHRRYIAEETLDVYDVPWVVDPRDPNYILVKQWVTQADQDIMFEHSRRLMESRAAPLWRSIRNRSRESEWEPMGDGRREKGGDLRRRVS